MMLQQPYFRACIVNILIVTISISKLYGFDVLQLTGQTEAAQIYKYLYHFEDTNGQISIHDAIVKQAHGKFQKLQSPTQRQEFGMNKHPRWFYFKLKTEEPTEQMLEIEYNNIDELELFEVKNGKIYSKGKTGDIFSYSQRPFQNNNYVFPIALDGQEEAAYYLRINQPHTILSFTIELTPRQVFLTTDRREYALWGMFIGVISIVLLVNMVMWLSTKDKIYIWYTLYVHFITMHLFADAGLAFQYLWNQAAWVNSFHPVYLYIWLGMIAQIRFMQLFIHQYAHNSKMYHWLKWFRFLVLACLVSVLLSRLVNWPISEEHLFKSITLISSLFVPVVFILTLLSLYEKRHQAEKLVKYYGWAIVIQFLGYLFVALVTFNQSTNQFLKLPFDILSYIIIGSILLIDILFFSFGLAFRYRSSLAANEKLNLELVQNRQEAQQKVIAALEDEQKRLAQDLHDDIGATLSTAKAYLSMLARKKPELNLQVYAEKLDAAGSELRELSHQLMPRAIDHGGLPAAIAESIHKVGGTCRFNFIHLGTIMVLSAQINYLFFKIAHEIIVAIAKKSSATEATVQLIQNSQSLDLLIEHDGSYENDIEEYFIDIKDKAMYINALVNIDKYENGFTILVSLDTSTEKKITSQ